MTRDESNKSTDVDSTVQCYFPGRGGGGGAELCQVSGFRKSEFVC